MERTNYPKRIQSTWRILLGLLCLYAAIAFPFHSGFNRLIFGLAGIGLIAPGFGWLRLTDEGFTYRTLLWGKSARWADIASIGIVTQSLMVVIPVTRNVGWRYAAGVKRPVLAKLSSAMYEYDEMLPSSYGMTAVELVMLMEAYRQIALTSHSSASRTAASRTLSHS